MSAERNTYKERPIFVVHLHPEPGVDPIHSLRHALKRLLRDYGMRAITIDARIEEQEQIELRPPRILRGERLSQG